MQLGSVVYNFNNAAALGPNALNNGLSVTGGIGMLGGPLGAATAANLLNNREIPFNTFSLELSGIANPSGNSLIIKNFDAVSISPQITFQGSGGAAIGLIRFDPTAQGTMFIGVGAGVGVTGVRNIGLGRSTLAGTTTGTRNIAIGDGALQFASGTQNNCIGIGADVMDTNGAALGDFNICIGQNSLDNGLAVGTANIVIGSSVNNSIGGVIGNNNISIGNSIGLTGGLSNTMIFSCGGTGASSLGLSNVIVLGNNTQNILIGQVNGAFADNGNRLQISGKLNTGGAAPLTLGAGAADFGKVVTAASVLNATKYWEVSIDGVLLKVCIN